MAKVIVVGDRGEPLCFSHSPRRHSHSRPRHNDPSLPLPATRPFRCSELSLPPLIFEVNKVTDTDRSFHPANPLSDLFVLDPVDGLDMETILYKLLGYSSVDDARDVNKSPDKSKNLVENGRACLDELEKMLDDIASSTMHKTLTKQEHDEVISQPLNRPAHVNDPP